MGLNEATSPPAPRRRSSPMSSPPRLQTKNTDEGGSQIRSRLHNTTVVRPYPSPVTVLQPPPSFPSSGSVLELFEEYAREMEERKDALWSREEWVRSRYHDMEEVSRKYADDTNEITRRFLSQLQKKGITSSTLDGVLASLRCPCLMQQTRPHAHNIELDNRRNHPIGHTAYRGRDNVIRHVALDHLALIERQ